MPFKGFSAGKVRFTPLPGPFFRELLPEIDHLGELKVTLYAFWRLDRMEGTFRWLRRGDFLEDAEFMQGLGPDPARAGAALDDALQRCERRGTFLGAAVQFEGVKEYIYFINSPKGRAALQAIARGDWRPELDQSMPLELVKDRPNIYRLYEEHIGPLTPMIAEALRDAEQLYPESWLEEAIRIAVENNVRRWSYVEAILGRWQEGGRDERKDRRDTEKDRRRYIEGEFSDYIEQ